MTELKHTSVNLRAEVDREIATGNAKTAWALLGQVWQANPGPAQAGFVLSRLDQLRPALALTPCRLALLRSFTVEPVVPLLRAAAGLAGIDLQVQLGDFNTYAQEMLDPASSLYRFQPDVVVLAIQTRDVAPDLWSRFTELGDDQVNGATKRVINDYRSWMEAVRKHSTAHLIIHTLEIPIEPNQGVLDYQSERGQTAALRCINHELQQIPETSAGVHVLDYDALVARHGRERWHDEQKWLTMRMPIASDCLLHLVREWLRFIHPITGKVCKALVTDLDNTLWGGVIGEDGLTGIKLSSEYPGAAYLALQHALLDLHQRGVLLAICSKNNSNDAMEALEKHPDMLLRPQHFAARRINWTDKAQGIREIAAELNIGTDAVAFLDDNPVECMRVRSELPEVTVINLPADPMQYARILRECPVFERLTLSAEDRDRGRYYAEQRDRAELQKTATSLEDFYRSLQQVVEITPVSTETLARVAQLTQKTNQFNLTTHRYSEQEIAGMAADRNCRVLAARVHDRFGDNGLVGVAITRVTGDACEIDSFLLSCRVIGRGVETAMLAYVLEQARAQGLQQAHGWFVPTKKNAPARDFYSTHGFHPASEQDGKTLWTLPSKEFNVACPDWIEVKAQTENQ